MFGEADDDPFAQGEDDEAPEPPDQRPREQPPAAGLGPRAMRTVPASGEQLGVVLHNARIAISRLTSVSLPEEEMQALLAPYGTIQENVAELQRRLQDPAQQGADQGLDVAQDLSNFERDVQAWIEQVEAAVMKAVGQGQVAGLGRLGQANGGAASSAFPWVPVLVGAAGLGIAGYLVWQSGQKRGPLPARG